MAKHKFVSACRRGVSETASSHWMVAGLLHLLVCRTNTAFSQGFPARWLSYRLTPVAFCDRDAELPSSCLQVNCTGNPPIRLLARSN